MFLPIACEAQSLAWALAVLQIVGLLSAVLVRATVRGQWACQWLFFACLLLVGMGNVAAMAVSVGHWLLSAGTLALMILAAVVDFGAPAGTEPA